MIQIQNLGESTQVILETVDNTETVAIGFWFVHGSRDEGADYKGYAHFLEHMLFKGTKGRNSFEIARTIDRMGGIINAFTEKETTCFYAVVPHYCYETALDILLDMLFNSVFNANELEKEKEVVLNEILSIYDSPEDLGNEIFLNEMWKEHPLADKITSEIKSIKSANRTKALEYFNNSFLSSNIVITVAGKFQEKEVMARIKGSFLNYKRCIKPLDRIAPVQSKSIKFINDKFGQVQIYTGTQLEKIDTLKQYYVISILSTILGEAMSSRLFQKIREDIGLCYAIYSFRLFFSDAVLLMVHASTTVENTHALLKALNCEFKLMREENIGQLELDEAKSHITGNMLLSREDMENRMKRLARIYFLTNSGCEFDDSIKLIEGLSLDEINELVINIFKNENFNLLTYGNKGRIKWKGFEFDF